LSAASAAAGPAAPPLRLRTVFCTRGGLFGALVLRRLRACERIEICAIVRSTRILQPRYGWLRGALALIRRCGLAYALYLWCVTTLADVLCRAVPESAVPARTGAIPVHVTADINGGAGLTFLTGCAPQLLVSAFFDQRLTAAALSIPARGCVNIHPSLLPEFRGVDPVLRARVSGAAALGVTVHWMSPALDDGPVLAQRPVEVPPEASIFAATAALFRAGAELLVEGVERIGGRDPGAPQRGVGSYQGWPTRADVRALHAKGGVLIRAADLLACTSSL
jgi:methionyl-tRNA formyltransferase